VEEIDTGRGGADKDGGAVSGDGRTERGGTLDLSDVSLDLAVIVEGLVALGRRGRGGGRLACGSGHSLPDLMLVGPLHQLRPEHGLGEASFALKLLAPLVPAPLLHAVHADRARPRQSGEQDVLAEHPVLLPAEQDLTGEEQHVNLAAVLDGELRHRGLGALRDDQRTRLPCLVERDHLERR
jgi:hypothetical protein